MEMNDLAAMEVLKEIKNLMDSRLGDKLAPSPEEGGEGQGLEISSVKVLGDEMPEGSEEGGMSPEEMEQLKALRSSMG